MALWKEQDRREGDIKREAAWQEAESQHLAHVKKNCLLNVDNCPKVCEFASTCTTYDTDYNATIDRIRGF